MIIPIIVFFTSLIAMGFVKVLLDPAVQAMFAASANNSAAMGMLHAGWDYFLILFFVVGLAVLVILGQKGSGRGGMF